MRVEFLRAGEVTVCRQMPVRMGRMDNKQRDRGCHEKWNKKEHHGDSVASPTKGST